MERYETPDTSHIPVLLEDVLEALTPKSGDVYIDGTFGRGGYSRALLQNAPNAKVIGIDRDPEAIAHGKAMEKEFSGQLTVIQGNFDQMDQIAQQTGNASVNGVMLDLGVSSPQLDNSARGFSFMKDAPLDMRMGNDGPTAADIVNDTPEDELANILYRYGDEHKSRHIAHAIVAARQIEPITRTVQLANIIRGVVRKTGKTDPATKSFQALRIAVNDELGSLERGLQSAENILSPEGVLAVVSFHSLEDRIVKNFMRERSGSLPSGSRHMPQVTDSSMPLPSFDLFKKSTIKPSSDETKNNPRARSARLRVAVRTDAPAWSKGGTI